MPNQPALNCIVRITARDINNNNVQKSFFQVRQLEFDYTDAVVNIIDVTGSFYFPLTPTTTITYTIVTGTNGQHTVVIS